MSVEQAKKLKLNLKSIWFNYFLPADVDHDGSVEEVELVNYMRSALTNDKKRMAITDTLPLIFDAIDYNRDDGVSVDEFSVFFRSLGIEDTKVSLFIYLFVFFLFVQNAKRNP